IAGDAINAIGHPEEHPRQLKAYWVHVYDSDLVTSPVQHAGESSATAAQEQDIATYEQLCHQDDVVDACFAAREHAALNDPALAVEAGSCREVLYDGDLSVRACETSEDGHSRTASS